MQPTRPHCITFTHPHTEKGLYYKRNPGNLARCQASRFRDCEIILTKTKIVEGCSCYILYNRQKSFRNFGTQTSKNGRVFLNSIYQHGLAPFIYHESPPRLTYRVVMCTAQRETLTTTNKPSMVAPPPRFHRSYVPRGNCI